MVVTMAQSNSRRCLRSRYSSLQLAKRFRFHKWPAFGEQNPRAGDLEIIHVLPQTLNDCSGNIISELTQR